MALLLLYVALALVVSFICSMLEAVLLSVTPAHVAVLEKAGHPSAPRLRALKADIDRPLAAILTLNTMAHTVGAAGAGAQAAKIFGDNAVGVFSGILTLLILVATEIVPKTLGAVHWKRLAPLVARVLRVLILVLWPLVRLAQWLTRLLTPSRDRGTVSRAEIEAIAEEGEREGVMEAGESRVVRNLMRLSALRVRDIMTPADHLVSLPEELDVGEVVARHPDLPFSRIPLSRGEGQARTFTGYVLKDDVLAKGAHDEHAVPLTALRRELLTVPDEMPLPAVFDRMVDRREHIALATDEAGGMTGVVTMEDVVETLLGLEIFDEVDDARRIHELARAHWRERARRLGRLSDAAGGSAQLGITGEARADPRPDAA